MDIVKIVTDIIAKHDAIELQLAEKIEVSAMTTLVKERAEISDIATAGHKHLQLLEQISSIKVMLQDVNLEQDIRLMACEELDNLQRGLLISESAIKAMLIPNDASDRKNALLEIRQGAGGNEAGLFGQEMLHMYQRYSERQGWKFELMTLSVNDVGGLKEAVVLISGKNVFSKMKFESGTHRVQRVPSTENRGRVHTSTVTVAVLPEIEDIDVKIKEKDLRIDVFRSSGPGGQSVNTTDSAIRITHIPSGITVSMQDERSQIKNRDKAMKILRSKIYENEKDKRHNQIAQERRDQIGTGERSEKIRTYNYSQNRVTDHRVNIDIHALDAVINEGNIDDIIDALIRDDEARKLANFENGD